MITYLIIHLIASGALLACGLMVFSSLCNYDELTVAELRRVNLMLYGLPSLVLILAAVEWILYRGAWEGDRSKWIYVLGASPLGNAMALLWIIPVSTGVRLFQRDYLQRLKSIENDLGSLDVSYTRYRQAVKNADWSRAPEQFLKEGFKRAPFFLKGRFRALQDSITQLKQNAPSEAFLAQARDCMRFGNAHRAVNFLQEWRDSWQETRKAMQKLADSVHGTTEDGELFKDLKKKAGTDANASLPLKALDFVQVHEEQAREGIWQRAKSALSEGNYARALEVLMGDAGSWLTAWEEALQQRLTETLLISVEMNAFNKVDAYIGNIKSASLRTEVNQMIAYATPEGTGGPFEEALDALRLDGVVGNRRIAFIRYGRGQRAEAAKLLSQDIEARHWLSASDLTN